jgi:hypothetical protein
MIGGHGNVLSVASFRACVAVSEACARFMTVRLHNTVKKFNTGVIINLWIFPVKEKLVNADCISRAQRMGRRVSIGWKSIRVGLAEHQTYFGG